MNILPSLVMEKIALVAQVTPQEATRNQVVDMLHGDLTVAVHWRMWSMFRLEVQRPIVEKTCEVPQLRYICKVVDV